MEYEVLNIVDELDDIEFMSEMAVMDAMLDVYTKQATMLQYVSEEYIQEGLKDDIKVGIKGVSGESVLKKILLFIPRLIASFVQWVSGKLHDWKGKIKDIKKAASIVKDLSPEERDELENHLENQMESHESSSSDGDEQKIRNTFDNKDRPKGAYFKTYKENLKGPRPKTRIKTEDKWKTDILDLNEFKKYLETEKKIADNLKDAMDSFDGNNITGFAEKMIEAFSRYGGIVESPISAKNKKHKYYTSVPESLPAKYLNNAEYKLEGDLESLEKFCEEFESIIPEMEEINKLYKALSTRLTADFIEKYEDTMDADPTIANRLSVVADRMRLHVKNMMGQTNTAYIVINTRHRVARNICSWRNNIKKHNKRGKYDAFGKREVEIEEETPETVARQKHREWLNKRPAKTNAG